MATSTLPIVSAHFRSLYYDSPSSLPGMRFRHRYRFHRLTTLIIHHPLQFHSRLKTFLFFFRADSTDSPDCLPIVLRL